MSNKSLADLIYETRVILQHNQDKSDLLIGEIIYYSLLKTEQDNKISDRSDNEDNKSALFKELSNDLSSKIMYNIFENMQRNLALIKRNKRSKVKKKHLNEAISKYYNEIFQMTNFQMIEDTNNYRNQLSEFVFKYLSTFTTKKNGLKELGFIISEKLLEMRKNNEYVKNAKEKSKLDFEYKRIFLLISSDKRT